MRGSLLNDHTGSTSSKRVAAYLLLANAQGVIVKYFVDGTVNTELLSTLLMFAAAFLGITAFDRLMSKPKNEDRYV